MGASHDDGKGIMSRLQMDSIASLVEDEITTGSAAVALCATADGNDHDDAECMDIIVPDVTWSSAISDAYLDTQFWQSPEYKALMQSYFNCSIFMIVLSDIFIFRRCIGIPLNLGVRVLLFFVVVGCVAAIWCYWKTSSVPESRKFDWHKGWLCYIKIETMVFLTCLLLAFQYLATKRLGDQLVTAAFYEHSDPPVPLITIRNLLVSSAAFIPVLCVTNAALPFKYLLASQVYVLLNMMFIYQPIALYILHCGGSTKGIQQVCEVIADFTNILEGLVIGPSRIYTPHSAVCNQHHVTIVVMFVQWVCTYLPLHVCYRLEWLAKMKFIGRLYDLDEPEESHVLYDIGFAVCTLCAMWIAAHTTLLQYAWRTELHFEDCQSGA